MQPKHNNSTSAESTTNLLMPESLHIVAMCRLCLRSSRSSNERCLSSAPVLTLTACKYAVEHSPKQLECCCWEEQRPLPAASGVQQVASARHTQHARHSACSVGDAQQRTGVLGGQVLQAAEPRAQQGRQPGISVQLLVKQCALQMSSCADLNSAIMSRFQWKTCRVMMFQQCAIRHYLEVETPASPTQSTCAAALCIPSTQHL